MKFLNTRLIIKTKMKAKIVVLSFFLLSITFSVVKSQTIAEQPPGWTDGSGGTITTLAHLRWLSETNDAWDEEWELGADIDATETNTWNVEGEDTLGFSPVGHFATRFTGEFKGNRYRIKNLYINRPTITYVGLFGYCNNAHISDIYLESANVTGNNGVGSLSGYSFHTTINNAGCINQKVTGLDNSVGGLLGFCYGSDISECFSKGIVSADGNRVGGLVGNISNSTITNCFARDTVTGNDDVGGFIGALNGNISFSYCSGKVSGTIKVGGFIGYNEGNISDVIIDTTHTSGLPAVRYELTGTSSIVRTDAAGLADENNFQGWDLDYIWELAVVPEIALTQAQFYPCKYLYRYDIFFGQSIAYSTNFNKIKPVNTGNSVTLIAEPKTGYAFTAWTLGEDTVSTSATYDFVYTADSNQTYVAHAEESWSFAGGNGSYSEPYQIENLTQLAYLSNVTSLLSYSFELVADIDATDTKNWNDGKGFSPIGDNSSSTQKSRQGVTFSGMLDGNNHVISDLYINRPNEKCVGLVGYKVFREITNIGLVDADITGGVHCGGIIGYSNGSDVINCNFNGILNAEDNAGGIVGVIYTPCDIIKCFASGKVTSNLATGGILGRAAISATIKECYSDVVVKGNNVGGLVGMIMGGSVSNCFASDSVIGNNMSTGGLLGITFRTTVSNSYSVGSVSKGSHLGGFCGTLAGTSEDNVFDINTSGQLLGVSSDSNNVKTIPLNSTSFNSEANFPNWNFTDIWKIEDVQNIDSFARPYLQWMNIARFETGGKGYIDGFASSHVLYNRNSPIVVAEPYEGYHFVKWETLQGDDAGNNKEIRINNVISDTTLVAIFDTNKYVVNFTAIENGSIRGESRQTVKHWKSTTAVTAEPNNDYAFKEWQDASGNLLSKENPIIVSPTGNVSYFAKFDIGYQATFRNSFGGTISGDTLQLIAVGENTKPVTAVSRVGYVFDEWQNLWGDSISASNPFYIDSIISDTLLIAKYAEAPQYNVVFRSDENGSIQGDTNQVVFEQSNSEQVTAIPNSGYQFDSWVSLAGRFVSDENPISITNVLSDTTLMATFTLITSIADLNKDNNLIIYPNPAGEHITLKVSEPGVIQIFNSTGNIVQVEHIYENSSNQINLNGYSNGLYFIRYNSESKIITSSFIKR